MKVKANTYVTKDGYPVFLRAGDDIPEGVEVTNPDVLGEPDADESEAEVTGADGEDEDDLAVVVTSDGVEHVGVLPASAATEKVDTPKAPAKRTARKAADSE